MVLRLVAKKQAEAERLGTERHNLCVQLEERFERDKAVLKEQLRQIQRGEATSWIAATAGRSTGGMRPLPVRPRPTPL